MMLLGKGMALPQMLLAMLVAALFLICVATAVIVVLMGSMAPAPGQVKQVRQQMVNIIQEAKTLEEEEESGQD